MPLDLATSLISNVKLFVTVLAVALSGACVQQNGNGLEVVVCLSWAAVSACRHFLSYLGLEIPCKLIFCGESKAIQNLRRV